MSNKYFFSPLFYLYTILYSQENGACGGTLTEHFVSLPESNLSTVPGFLSSPSSELPSPNSNDISTELNNRLIPNKYLYNQFVSAHRKHFVRY